MIRNPFLLSFAGCAFALIVVALLAYTYFSLVFRPKIRDIAFEILEQRGALPATSPQAAWDLHDAAVSYASLVEDAVQRDPSDETISIKIAEARIRLEACAIAHAREHEGL